MKSKGKLRFLLGLLIIFTIYLQFFIPTIKGVEKELTISMIADKDTYVDKSSSNFGGQDYLVVKYPFKEAYFHFNFSDKPTTFTKAEISLDFWSVSETMNFTVCLINASWEETTMIWSNKPAKGDKIGNLIVSGNRIYKIDVTNFIVNLSSISICVYIDEENYIVDYAYITSREGYSSWSPEDAPQLIWTYLDDVTITVTNPSSSTKLFEWDYYTIRWTTSTDTISDVKIELYKGSTFMEEITPYSGYTTNDGSYDFYVSSSNDYKGTNYRIKISDYDDPQVYDFSDYFSINIGTISVINPTINSKWTAGNTYTIQWSNTEGVSTVNIEIYKGDTLRYVAESVSTSLGWMRWKVPDDVTAGDDWRVKIIDADLTSVFDWSEYFSIEYNYSPLIIGIILGSIALVAIILVIHSSRKKRRPIVFQTDPRQIPHQNPQQPLSTKYCIKCGNPNKEDNTFCDKCGTKMAF